MKNKIGILFGISLLLGCVTSKDVEKLLLDKTKLFPIGENGKWGYYSQNGERIIEPIYDHVEFFREGLGLVKYEGKYGYIKKDGSWHLKPKYDSASSFHANHATVSIKDKTFYINRKGKRFNKIKHYPIDLGGCNIITPIDPEKYFFKVNGKYEIAYKYYLISDSSKTKRVVDTSDLKIDEVKKYGNEHILMSRNNKYGLYNTWPKNRITFNAQENINFKEAAKSEFLKRIKFKYDDIRFERRIDRSVSYAAVRIDDKWGIIDRFGFERLKVKYHSIIKLSLSMALVEFEKGRFGYKRYSGEEFFKRKEK
ncbi:MAG: WG repeat-containing protein [Saprospiraceae bacterium]